MQPDGRGLRHVICAIITPNYLGQFLVLGESVARTMPSTDLRVLILQDCTDVASIQESIDDYLTRTGSPASHRAITIDECEWGDFDVESAALFYDILEFATSVKPALMRSLLKEGWERVTYLDPDIQVFGDFTPLLDDESDVTLTPHLFSDIPKDHLRPSTHDILLAGFFNLGFCSARPSSFEFLDWWSGRLQFDCLNDHLVGYFTDQKIVDLAPLKANVQVLSDPGCNVAYWNLHERRVVEHEEDWGVAVLGVVSPLYFFHFSGFGVEPTPSLSIHSDRPVLGDNVPRPFATQYAERLQRTPAWAEPFTLAGMSLTHAVPTAWNTAIREDVEIHVRAGHSLRDVREQIYALDHPQDWTSCRACGQEHGNFGSRARSFLVGWASHPSLQGVPNAISAFFRTAHYEFRATPMEQLSWATDGLAAHLVGDDDLKTEVLQRAGAAIRDSAKLKLVGYFSYPAGIGQVARSALGNLEAAGIHPAVERVYAVTDSAQYLSTLLTRDNPLAAANASALCFVNADQWQLHVRDPQRVNERTQRVEAVWAWELEEIPPHMFDVAANGHVARIHALSNWSAASMAKVLPVPVQRLAPFNVGLFVTLTRDVSHAPVAGVTGRYILTSLDAKSYLSRKNPEGALELWRRVQADYPDYSLVIKSAALRDFAPASLLDQIDSSTRTILIDEYLDDDNYLHLLTNCEVFLSLHRSEGMGLTPIEAGMLGLPVVYTNFGGVTDFMQNGFYPVSYSMVRVGESPHDTGPYDPSAFWAEPDLDDAERQLRRALQLGRDDDALSALVVDQKQLMENLMTAQAEVVATAERLLLVAGEDISFEDHPRLAELVRPTPVPEVIATPKPNALFYGVTAVVWWVYKSFPRSVRFQFNLALQKLRGGQDGNEAEPLD